MALVYLIVCSLLMSGYVFVQAAEEQVGGSKDSDYIENVMDMVIDRYKGEIDRQKLLEGALKGLFSTMDPYTTLLYEGGGRELYGKHYGTFVGIGIAYSRLTENSL